MRLKMGAKILFAIVLLFQLVNVQAESTSNNVKVFEGKLLFNQELPVDINAGNEQYSELIKIESIRLENRFSDAWKVSVCIGWLPVIDSSWKIKVQLLDETGHALSNGRDNDAIITCNSSSSSPTQMRYTNLDLDSMTFISRRHASGFQISIEPFNDTDTIQSGNDGKTHTLEMNVVELKNNNPVPSAVLVVRVSNKKELYVTDSQGHCKINIIKNELPRLDIEVQKPGFATMYKSWSSPSSAFFSDIPLTDLPESHKFELLSVRTLGGIVKNEDGDTIEGVAVHFESSLTDRSGNCSRYLNVLTDSNGQWRVDGVPSETDRVSIILRHPDYGGDQGSYRYIRGDELIDAQALKRVDILQKGIAISGHVLDENGQALANATAMLSLGGGIPFYGITDSSGEFIFICPSDPEIYNDEPSIIVEAPGFAPQLKIIEITPDIEPLEFHLNSGKTVKCHVVDKQGNPVVGASAIIQPFFPDSGEYSLWLEKSDSNGVFEIPNAPETNINLTVLKSGYNDLRGFIIKPTDEILELSMRQAASVQGQVTDAKTGEPIPYFEITPSYFSGSRNDIGGSVVFADGNYELLFNEASLYSCRLTIFAVGYNPGVSDIFNLEEGNYEMNFELQRAANYRAETAGQIRPRQVTPTVRRISGIVKDNQGNPVSDVLITTRPMQTMTDTFTDSDGIFSIRLRTNSSAFEEIYILARQKEKNLACATRLQETEDYHEIVLLNGVIFSGQVVDINDRGIQDSQISLTFWLGDSGYGAPEPTEIDSNGNFEIRAVPHGFRYSIEAKANGYGPRYVKVHTSEAINDQIKLEPLVLKVADLPTSGIVVDEYEQPVENVRIYAYGNGQPTQETYTDENGRFTLDKICTGKISIQANKENPERFHSRIEAEGGAQDIRIVVNQLDSEGRTISRTLPSLIGKQLPFFKNITTDFSLEQARNKSMLICFWDMEQRPSRHYVTELVNRSQMLEEKNIVVFLIQIPEIEQEKIDEWVKENDISFPVGIIDSDPSTPLGTGEKQIRFNWGINSMPWLILTDEKHVVINEGFGISELEEKFKELKNVEE